VGARGRAGLTAIALSLAASLVWGTADFLGGLTSRRMVVLAVLLWSQLVGLLLVLTIVGVGGYALVEDGIGWGVAAGLVGVLALGLFYAGLAAGAMSLVAPLTACGAVVPVVVALADGESLEALAVAGMAIALAGAVLVSRTKGPSARLTPKVVAMAVGAGLAFGGVITMFQQGAAGGDDARLTVVLVARVASILAVSAAILATRTSPAVPGRSAVPLLLGVGLGDAGANVLLMFASGGGQDAIVAVLSSLYPVVTVVLARAVLGERLSGWQAAGVAAALVGVALVSAA
jgi:drug/metabolite transporter (DMT)-like permease